MKNKQQRVKILFNELRLYTEARAINNHEECLKHLGRAHILSQSHWFRHLYIHFLMFEYAWKRKDLKELMGQSLRVIITIPGHMIGKVPKGNIGWSTMGLLETSQIPNDLKDFF